MVLIVLPRLNVDPTHIALHVDVPLPDTSQVAESRLSHETDSFTPSLSPLDQWSRFDPIQVSSDGEVYHAFHLTLGETLCLYGRFSELTLDALH
jgi:hypothetical protein